LPFAHNDLSRLACAVFRFSDSHFSAFQLFVIISLIISLSSFCVICPCMLSPLIVIVLRVFQIVHIVRFMMVLSLSKSEVLRGFPFLSDSAMAPMPLNRPNDMWGHLSSLSYL
jgi:nucleoside recognition membrane protein YjiH